MRRFLFLSIILVCFFNITPSYSGNLKQIRPQLEEQYRQRQRQMDRLRQSSEEMRRLIERRRIINDRHRSIRRQRQEQYNPRFMPHRR